MSSTANQNLRKIPSVDVLLRSDELGDALDMYGRSQVLIAVQNCIEEVRQLILDGEPVDLDDRPIPYMAGRVREKVGLLAAPSQVRVFNLTGTIIHTNLGRAPLPEEAIQAVQQAARYPLNLEFNLQSGRRGDRDDHLEHLLCQLTGAEAATVVNNNAAAVMLGLNTLALRREVLVSRGQLIEIGGSFRMPDIMKRAGAKLYEVGTTNRTHPGDFSSAISKSTGLVMEVHTSNYQINGFTSGVSTHQLAKLADDHSIPFMVDLGRGTLIDLERLGLPHEPTVAEVVAAGAHLVTFSGDKLLGGPQAGIIVGRADLIAKIKRNPMKRAMRSDKLAIAALQAVLQLYADPDRVLEKIPALRMLNRPLADLDAQAMRLLPVIKSALAGRAAAEAITCRSEVGSGALPTAEKESVGIAISADGSRGNCVTLRGISSAFRRLPIPVVGRLTGKRFVLDLRGLDDEESFVQQLGELDLTEKSDVS